VRLAAKEIVVRRSCGNDHSFGTDFRRDVRHERPGQVLVNYEGGGLRVAQYVCDFFRMQLGIDRNSDQAGPPDGIERFKVFRAVIHHDRHAIARLQPQPASQAAGQARDPVGQRSIIVE
jgi:hypothetical protein